MEWVVVVEVRYCNYFMKRKLKTAWMRLVLSEKTTEYLFWYFLNQFILRLMKLLIDKKTSQQCFWLHCCKLRVSTIALLTSNKLHLLLQSFFKISNKFHMLFQYVSVSSVKIFQFTSRWYSILKRICILFRWSFNSFTVNVSLRILVIV